VDSTQIRLLEQTDEIGLCTLLQRQDRVTIEAKVLLEVLRHHAHQTRERSFANVELNRLLVLPGKFLPKGISARALAASKSNIGIHLISLSATVLGQYRWGFFTPPVKGAALLRAAFATESFCGALPPVDLRAVCLVLRQLASVRCDRGR
jgi:hypothetical protein